MTLAPWTVFLVLAANIAYAAPPTPLDNMPEEFRGVGVDEHPAASLPLDAAFTDENGKAVKLADYFDGKRPVLLQLGYYDCPMLCSLVAQGMAQSMRELDLVMARDFRVVTISFDPKEKHDLARRKKASYAKEYTRGGVEEGWHFLVGEADQIARVTSATGFKYKWVEAERQFSHAAVLMVLTPDGKMSRYLYGVKYDPKTLRLSLVEASEGKIGSTSDKVLLFCLHYDPKTGKYSLAVANFMRLGAAVTILVLGLAIWRMARRARRRVAEADLPGPAGA